MCDATAPQGRGSPTRGRGAVNVGPRWGLLYIGTLSQLAALGAAEAVHSPHLLRVTLRCLLAVGIFATMSVWLRTNRPALDLQDWCDCAGARMTIRVIDSEPARPAARRFEPPFIPPVPVDEEHELAGR
jgi:hypothetical protein